jgi:Zn-dependent metalloprotease
VFKKIPVWAAEINVHLDTLNNVYLVQGRYIPTPEKINIHPALNKEAVQLIVADSLGIPGSEYFKWPSEMIIFSAPDAEPCLAYRVVTSLNETDGWAFIIDATTGAVLEKLPANYNGNAGLIKNN